MFSSIFRPLCRKPALKYSDVGIRNAYDEYTLAVRKISNILRRKWKAHGSCYKDGINKSEHCFEMIMQLRTPSRKFLATPLLKYMYILDHSLFTP